MAIYLTWQRGWGGCRPLIWFASDGSQVDRCAEVTGCGVDHSWSSRNELRQSRGIYTRAKQSGQVVSVIKGGASTRGRSRTTAPGWSAARSR